MAETRARSAVKSVLWRIVGIIWTWVGAYVILALTPERYSSAAIVATSIVVFHHSTRMIMYYAYERIWNAVKWGRVEVAEDLGR